MDNLIRLLLEGSKRYDFAKCEKVTNVKEMCEAFEANIVAEIFFSLYREEKPMIEPEEVFEICQEIIDQTRKDLEAKENKTEVAE